MITKEMTILEALMAKEKNEDAVAEVLMDMGMHCIGCAMSSGETLEEAATEHGIDVTELLEKLNAIED